MLQEIVGTSLRIGLLVALATGLAGCGTAKLSAADKYAGGIKASINALQALVDDQAASSRIYAAALTVSPADAMSPEMTTTFKDLACRAYEPSLVDLSLALAQLGAYQAYVAAAAGDPDDVSLAGKVASVAAAGQLVYETPATQEIRDEMLKRKAACDADVAALLPTPKVKGFSAVLAVWPSIKTLLDYVAGTIDTQARVAALKRLARDEKASREFKAALEALRSSKELQDSLQHRRQEALWLAAAHYKQSQQMSAADAFVGRHKAATKMNTALEAYQRYAEVDLVTLLNKVQKAQDAFVKNTLDNNASLADLIAVLDFLSGLSEKVADARKKIEEAKE
jgi:hypothetical protein